jgi:hypothetical protein
LNIWRTFVLLFAFVSSFGSFASVSFASGKNKGRKKSSFPLWGNRKEKNFVLPKVNKKKGEEKKGNVFMSSLGISSGTSPEGM